MSHAVVLGGTGLIGRAAARRLLAAGWDVTAVGRDRSRMPEDVAAVGGRFIAADRTEPHQLAAALGAGADLLIDCLCFTAGHARSLLPLLDDVGSAVMISSNPLAQLQLRPGWIEPGPAPLLCPQVLQVLHRGCVTGEAGHRTTTTTVYPGSALATTAVPPVPPTPSHPPRTAVVETTVMRLLHRCRKSIKEPVLAGGLRLRINADALTVVKSGGHRGVAFYTTEQIVQVAHGHPRTPQFGG